MSILSLRMNFPGDNYQAVRLGRLHSSDNLATVTAAGYLNNYVKMNAVALYKTDFVHVAASDGNQIYKPTFSASGVITLSSLP
jgi:hypothetical protein